MIKSKREWRCSTCDQAHIKWQGICNQCGAIATLQEIVLLPTNVGVTGKDATRRLQRRAKNSERDIARRMSNVDGPDPNYSKIASSTGRIGHITGIRVDAISKTYVTENKNRKLPSWFIDAWILINQRAKDFNKNALLHIEPPNMPKEIQINGRAEKLDTMAVIPQTRHEELIRTEQALNEMISQYESGILNNIEKIYDILYGRNKE